MAKDFKLDIFETLGAIDKRDYEFLDRQPPDARKAFAPRVVLRWASTIRGELAPDNIWLVNEIANIQFDDLYSYPDLQFRLLAMSGMGTRQRHEWIPLPKASKATTKLQDFLSKHWPYASYAEIKMLLSKFDKISFTEFVHGSGATPEEAKELIKAFSGIA